MALAALLTVVCGAAPGPSGCGSACLLFLEYRTAAGPALDRSCVFEPSCSRYAEQAMERLGPLAGAAVAFERWTRCHDFARSEAGYSLERGRIRDPLSPGRGEEEEWSWGRSLLPF